MHELYIIFEVELVGFESFLVVLDRILQFGSLFFFDDDVHLGEIDFFLLF